MEGNSVKISVIICTYNNASILDRVLDRLARQYCPEGWRWELLVIDNNCADETRQVVERHRKSGQLARLAIVSESTQGLTPARRRGAKETTGEWLAFVDDDCLLDERWLDTAMRFADAHPRCGALGGLVRPHWEGGAEPLPDSVAWTLACQDHGRKPCRIWSLVGAGLILRRTALEQTGWIDAPFLADRIGQRLVSGGDMEISLRIAACGWDLWYTPDCVIDHVIPAHRTSPNYLKRLAFGLGISQIMVDALVCERGLVSCMRRSARSAARQTVYAMGSAIRDLVRGRDRRPSSIKLHFAFGNWAGIGKLPSKRSLIGAIGRSPRQVMASKL